MSAASYPPLRQAPGRLLRRLNCSSTHSPRCLKLLNLSQSFLLCLLLFRVVIPVLSPYARSQCFALARPHFVLAGERMRSPLRVLVRSLRLANKKGAPCRPRLLTRNCVYTFRIANWKGQTGRGWRLYIVVAFIELSPIVQFLPIDRFR
jgi:hypothetical protein